MIEPAKRTNPTSLQLARWLGSALDQAGARDVVFMKMRGLLDTVDYFVVCHGLSAPHLKALAESIPGAAAELGVPAGHRERHSGLRWVVFDLGSVIVHIFTEEARCFYALESLWSDAPTQRIRTGDR